MGNNKIEIARELINITKPIDCKDCPLDSICDFLINGDSDFNGICDELHFLIENKNNQ